MTYTQFFKRLSKVNRKWWLVGPTKQIRSGQTCPVVAVAGGFGGEWWLYSRRIGLTFKSAHNLVIAADNEAPYSWSSARTIARLRKQMLKVVGLHEAQ